MDAAMSQHHYVLQYHIYAVAMHRYLQLRLGEAYSFASHFGGVRYLFLRGMSPDYAQPEQGCSKIPRPKRSLRA